MNYGVAEILDILYLADWLFTSTDFNEDYMAENLGFKIQDVRVDETLNINISDSRDNVYNPILAKKSVRKRRATGKILKKHARRNEDSRIRMGRIDLPEQSSGDNQFSPEDETASAFDKWKRDLSDSESSNKRHRREADSSDPEEYGDSDFEEVDYYQKKFPDPDKGETIDTNSYYEEFDEKTYENEQKSFPYSRRIYTSEGRKMFKLFQSKVAASQSSFSGCCVILGFMFHDISPLLSVTNARKCHSNLFHIGDLYLMMKSNYSFNTNLTYI